ncbi:Crp/Fnr family transcriptional regulator [Pararcticibacter amylolyticus]|uniref:Crp/Fnr family transcriptional regulator n=1 Tax=Pararcticibacter amylolyticus TaxID=2173175 RepID=A0A2U2PEV2_9SPHI|nr:Crp/Fnr family transcriptional regulator [Pararcticibacter amylolyticus]PWG79921.1 Crp/Fnr family transcriptional regulator [Pararcticibacter amylolyticus]
MSDLFRKHLEKFIEVDDSEFDAILRYFTLEKVTKKENLMMAGSVCRSHFFVLQGCLRKFFINEKGIEQTTEFAIENWWLTDNLAYEQQGTSEFYIQAVERSEVLTISKPSQDKLLQDIPKMERYFRFIYQRAYAASQMRIKYLYDFSREELYFHFLDRYPAFIQRIPQYLIASFLGFTPEYLSEIRAKKRS